MGTQGTGRKRSTKKERSTAEDDALNLIAREAEARLAAKRAARAEAREIRMKELERQQKELSDDDERMSVGSRGSVRVEDRDYLEKGSRAASALTAGTLTSLGGSSSRRGSGETALTIDAETSLREIKDALAEVEEKYRKAMVSNAQLDNEKNNLMYQVDTLKDSLMELEEQLSESQRSYEEKVKEFEREKHAHSVLQFQFNEMKEMLKQSEELLNKHGIVLGPDLNINGDIGEALVDESPGADPASQPAPDSQTSPTEGNSMLGNTEETQLRSSGEEEVDPEQHQEMFEEAKENHLSADTLCNVAGVSTLETPNEEQPAEEQQTCLATEEDNVGESDLSNDLNVDINDHSVTEAKDMIVCSPEPRGIVTSSEENVPETETPEGGDLGETGNPDLGETETKSSSVETHSDDIRESCNDISEAQENKQEDVEESNLRNTESCPQQEVAQDNVKESLPDESVPPVSNAEPQQEQENAEEAENDETEETSSKSQPQGATASGKKKRKKRRGKKKGGAHEEKNQQKDGTDTEKSKTEKHSESAPIDKEPTTEPNIEGSVTETVKESKVDQVKNEQDRQETEEVDGGEAVKPTETVSHNETLKESRMDHVTDEHNEEQTNNVEEVEAVTTTETFSCVEPPIEIRVDHVVDEQNEEQSLEAETVETVEAAAPTETSSHVEPLEESGTDPQEGQQDGEPNLETEKVEEVGSITSPVPETNLSTSDLIDNSKSTEDTDGHDPVCASSVDNSKSGTDTSTNGSVVHTLEIIDSAKDEVGATDELESECATNNPENTFETSSKENTEAESHVPSDDDIAANESAEGKDNTSEPLSSTDGLESLSEPPSELSAAVDSGSDDTPIKVSDGEPEEATESAKDDEEPGAETEQESISPSHEEDNSEPKPDRREEEEPDGDLREPENLVESDGPLQEEKRDSCDASDSEKTLLETVEQSKQPDDVESQTLQCEDHDESNAEVSSETEVINTNDTLNTADSPKEAPEIKSSIEQDDSTEESAVAEDPEHKNSENDQQSETHLCPSEEQLHEPSKDTSEDNDSSQPTLQDCDKEDSEDEEGQSFDFDDLDVEVAVATNLPKQEEVKEGAEATSDGSSGLCQSNTNKNTQDEPVENSNDKCTVDGGNQVDTLDKESGTVPCEEATSEKRENVCEKQKTTPEEEVDVAEEARQIIEEGTVMNAGEAGVVSESVNQTVSLPVEEGLDAVQHELQGEDSVLPKSADQVAANKDPRQTGKDAKKNGKKGKAKGKEDCKMS